MKKLFASFGWILLLLPFISVAGTKTIFHSINSIISTEDRKISNFHGISSAGSYDVYVKMGSTESLRIDGDKDVVANIETVVENGILKIRNSGPGKNWWNNDKIKIYITAKSLNYLTVSGSGNLKVDGTLKSDKISAKVSGSGNMDLNVLATTFNISISGSGNVKAYGQAKKTNIEISGSGEFEGNKLKTSVCNVKVSGSGNASIYAEEELNAKISGSGDISYWGKARVNQVKSGSGSISRH